MLSAQHFVPTVPRAPMLGIPGACNRCDGTRVNNRSYDLANGSHWLADSLILAILMQARKRRDLP